MTLDQLGLLEATHGILSHAFRKFCALFVPKRLKADMAAASMADGSAEGEVADNAEGHDDDTKEPGDIVPGGGGGEDAVVLFPDQEPEWAAQNARHRKKAA